MQVQGLPSVASWEESISAADVSEMMGLEGLEGLSLPNQRNLRGEGRREPEGGKGSKGAAMLLSARREAVAVLVVEEA